MRARTTLVSWSACPPWGAVSFRLEACGQQVCSPGGSPASSYPCDTAMVLSFFVMWERELVVSSIFG